MKTYTIEQMQRAFEAGRNYQLTGENNFNELIESIHRQNQLFNDCSNCRYGYMEADLEPCFSCNLFDKWEVRR